MVDKSGFSMNCEFLVLVFWKNIKEKFKKFFWWFSRTRESISSYFS